MAQTHVKEHMMAFKGSILVILFNFFIKLAAFLILFVIRDGFVVLHILMLVDAEERKILQLVQDGGRLGIRQSCEYQLVNTENKAEGRRVDDDVVDATGVHQQTRACLQDVEPQKRFGQQDQKHIDDLPMQDVAQVGFSYLTHDSALLGMASINRMPSMMRSNSEVKDMMKMNTQSNRQ
eukprot:CAMPEP_0115698164 /NCGR_PEP_ID=MMETSP0272-20121206/66198_1 /TAXON_ID=71861 /ORGANISM="Scrippsiella trochoidea, Strain CCMP3099" /LENGTH=178 /DNA_ID=CAMNT_0003138501 /DNA_START=393 /DNA_END=929 /DNA_ORIENTATION=+